MEKRIIQATAETPKEYEERMAELVKRLRI